MVTRIDHGTMRRAAELPTRGPAATDTLAASGGLDLPAREPHATEPMPAEGVSPEPIPGERDPTTLATTAPAIVGTTGFGADLPATEDSTVDEESASVSRWEGGGKAAERTTRP